MQIAVWPPGRGTLVLPRVDTCRPARILYAQFKQWRHQLWGTGARAPSTSNNFIFSSLWSKSDSQLSKYPVVCEISWCRCQQLTAFSISTALVTKLLVIEQLLHPALKSIVSTLWHNFQLCPSSQQILATPLIRNWAGGSYATGPRHLSSDVACFDVAWRKTGENRHNVLSQVVTQYRCNTFTTPADTRKNAHAPPPRAAHRHGDWCRIFMTSSSFSF